MVYIRIYYIDIHIFSIIIWYNNYHCCWKKSCTSWDVQNPLINCLVGRMSESVNWSTWHYDTLCRVATLGDPIFSMPDEFLAGTHPLCCQGDYVVMEAVDFVIRTLSDSIQARETCNVIFEYHNLDYSLIVWHMYTFSFNQNYQLTVTFAVGCIIYF